MQLEGVGQYYIMRLGRSHKESGVPDRPHWLHACHEWLCQPVVPEQLPHSPGITQEETTQKESLLMSHFRRSAIREQSVILWKGIINVLIYFLLI